MLPGDVRANATAHHVPDVQRVVRADQATEQLANQAPHDVRADPNPHDIVADVAAEQRPNDAANYSKSVRLPHRSPNQRAHLFGTDQHPHHLVADLGPDLKANQPTLHLVADLVTDHEPRHLFPDRVPDGWADKLRGAVCRGWLYQHAWS